MVSVISPDNITSESVTVEVCFVKKFSQFVLCLDNIAGLSDLLTMTNIKHDTQILSCTR